MSTQVEVKSLRERIAEVNAANDRDQAENEAKVAQKAAQGSNRAIARAAKR